MAKEDPRDDAAPGKNNIKTIFTRFLPGERFAFENLTGLRRIKINSKSGSKHRCCHENLEDYTRKILTELLSGHGSAATHNIFTQRTKGQLDVFRPFLSLYRQCTKSRIRY